MVEESVSLTNRLMVTLNKQSHSGHCTIGISIVDFNSNSASDVAPTVVSGKLKVLGHKTLILAVFIINFNY